jgi:hypothetical protein
MLEFLKIITIFIYLAKINWHTTEWNGGVNIKQKDGGFVFILKPGAHINAVQAKRPAVRIGDIITITYKVKKLGSKRPRMVSLDPAPAPPGLKPNLRPMLQVQHDDYVSEDKPLVAERPQLRLSRNESYGRIANIIGSHTTEHVDKCMGQARIPTDERVSQRGAKGRQFEHRIRRRQLILTRCQRTRRQNQDNHC